MTETKSIEVPEPLTRLGERFEEAGRELYLVGGFVRDALSGSIGKDVDATTGSHPKEIKRLLGPVADHLWTVGERFGTIGARVGPYDVEVTTYRTDLYTQGSRHPEVRFGTDLVEDLARRDFTINAVAASAENGEIRDPFDGRKDLEFGVIRPVGDPLDRMRDDPLRMLRAVRFETTLSTSEKPFAMTPQLEAAIKENAHWLESISAERIRDEFEKILLSENVAKGLRTLVRLGLMPYIVPEFMETLNVEQEAEFHHKDVFEHTLIVTQNVEKDPILRKAAFFHDIGKPRTLVYEHRCTYCGAKSIQKNTEEGECEHCGGRTLPKKIHFYGHENVGATMARKSMKRLAYPKDDIDAVAHLVANHMRPMGYAVGRDPWSDSAIRRFIRDTHLSRGDRELANVDMLLKLAQADITGGAPRRRRIAEESWRSLKSRVDAVRAEDSVEKLESPLDGNDLMQLFGRGPGRWIKHVKDYLENETVEGRLGEDDTEKARELAVAYAREHDPFEEG
ncbi:MAG: CCA tRNA nucleotidyltransferase [uncultured Rubrobacteraceae bacterium]|uniref:CCA tRNA nucleotidyltransferase n=1 Tax=uncultured Rubrobacteraceae bacterium TaxID=349277 RepID=A0A6J4QHB7_9ACTN|nr:MAG: CCA tRNA nucleotidyltransferase [uncultured Rubrobacteraceae bacterium]